MFTKGFQKTAKTKEKQEGLSPSITGAVLGGVAGHQAAKYLGAKSGRLSHKVPRYLLTAMAAQRMATMVGNNQQEPK